VFLPTLCSHTITQILLTCLALLLFHRVCSSVYTLARWYRLDRPIVICPSAECHEGRIMTPMLTSHPQTWRDSSPKYHVSFSRLSLTVLLPPQATKPPLQTFTKALASGVAAVQTRAAGTHLRRHFARGTGSAVAGIAHAPLAHDGATVRLAVTPVHAVDAGPHLDAVGPVADGFLTETLLLLLVPLEGVRRLALTLEVFGVVWL
jgi:hypothetical protein